MNKTVSRKVANVIRRRREMRKLREVLDGLNTERARVSYVDDILRLAGLGVMSARLIASCELFGAVVNGDFDWCFALIPEMLAKWSAELMAAAGIADEPPRPVVAVVPEEEANAVVPEVIDAVVPEEEANTVVPGVVVNTVVPGVEVNTVVPLTPEQIEYAARAAEVIAAIERIRLSIKDEATEKEFEKISSKLHEHTRSTMNDIARGKVATDKVTRKIIEMLEIKVRDYNEWLAKHVKEMDAKKNRLPSYPYYRFD